MTQKYKFAEGERVLCFHGPLIYEAKALKSAISKDKQIKYYIHYAGWSKNWDEWVPENRVLKYNEANVQRQNEVYKQHSASTKTKKGSAKAKKSDISSESRAMTPSKDVSGTTASGSATTVTTSAGSRGNRSAKHAARPSTPVSSKDNVESSINKKEESFTKDESTSGASSTTIAKDDNKEETQKKKRGGSHTSDKSSTTTASTTPTPPNLSANASTTSAVSSSAISVANASSTNRLDSCVENEETFLSKIEVKIKIPEELKQCLTDDWDGVTRQRKLLEIPAKVTVQEIIDQYLAFKKTAKSTNATKEVAINDVLEGIIEYFNVMLGSQLLYKFERPQYADVLQKHPDTPPSQLYGSFHLLRLFVKLGSMLGYSALDEKAMQNLLAHIHDFLKFLVKNNATYFSMTNFVNADSAHYRQAQ